MITPHYKVGLRRKHTNKDMKKILEHTITFYLSIYVDNLWQPTQNTNYNVFEGILFLIREYGFPNILTITATIKASGSVAVLHSTYCADRTAKVV